MLSLGDAVIKFFSADFSIWQIYVVRSGLAAPVLGGVMWLHSGRARPGFWRSMRPRAWRWTLLRSALLAVTWALYYAALPHLGLSAAAAVLYTIPLFITMFSALFIGEKIGAAAWFAVAMGFIGALIIVRPAADDFNAHALLPMLAAILYAWSMLITRTKCRHEHPLTLSLWMNIMFIATGAIASLMLLLWQPESAAHSPFLFGGWRALTAAEWLLMGVLAATILLGTIFAAAAYQKAAPPLVATFEYTYLAFVVFWGFILLNETPDQPTVIGMVIIAAAGSIALRQRRRSTTAVK